MTIHAGSRLLLIAIAMLAIASSAAWAQPPGGSIRVAVGDLDFSRPRDVEVFRRRVDQAAHTLCAREGQLDFLEMSACYRGIRRQCVRNLSPEQRQAFLATSSKLRMW